eukprot:TRINITY_DN10941_c0_g2_i1.p1 TRINITY_DN10941_c0_g2~~TRINITY_DN10941_c0_g2_i1.p1  ORF type:complete len:339 (+),score=75.75 TRINITY_DN10941_c0_g2_i1:131-1147(+)
MEGQFSKKFRMGRKIGSGSFGDIFEGTNLETKEEVAIKTESVRAKQPQLIYEAKVYKMLGPLDGVPKLHWYGVEGEITIMVMDLLGPSIEDLFEFCDFKFGLKTVLMLADQLITRIELVHSRNFIHRDIKPDNFVMGLGSHNTMVHAIDFGLAKKYRDADHMHHIQYREQRSLIGTARYTSLNTHLGIEQSRRDDLEAIGYMFYYFLRGSLPWQSFKEKGDKYKKIMEKKASTPVEVLGKSHPIEFVAYMNYCRSLDFEDRPDYAFPRMILKDLFFRENFELDYSFDWYILNERRLLEKEAKYGHKVEETADDFAVRLRDEAARKEFKEKRERVVVDD